MVPGAGIESRLTGSRGRLDRQSITQLNRYIPFFLLINIQVPYMQLQEEMLFHLGSPALQYFS
jgi:hypothetical protein